MIKRKMRDDKIGRIWPNSKSPDFTQDNEGMRRG
jgi:hypothetical protein